MVNYTHTITIIYNITNNNLEGTLLYRLYLIYNNYNIAINCYKNGQ